MNNRDNIPVDLRETWAWKHVVYEETKALDTVATLRNIHAGAAAIRETYGLRVKSPTDASGMVAEESPKYGSEK